jgi:two-component system NtrC family response regulator
LPIDAYREAMEKRYLILLMEKTNNNTIEASRLAGLSRSRLYGLLKKHDIRW